MAVGVFMKQDDLFQVKVLDAGMDGEGIAKIDGYVVFIPFALKDEVLDIKITYVKKNFAYAKIVKIVEKSPFRITAPCVHFRQCGGCSLQHIQYLEQLNIKKESLIKTFKRNTSFDVEIKDVIFGKQEFYYRNKVQLPVGKAKNFIIVGFYKPESHCIVPLKECLLQGEWAQKFIDAFLDYADECNIENYDETTYNGILRHLVLRKVGNTVSVVVVINKDILPQKNTLIKHLKRVCIPFNLHLNINKNKNNVILGDKFILLHGEEEITAKVCNTIIKLSPQSFLQINDEMLEILYDNVKARLDKDNDIVIDVYSGIGIMTNIIAEKAKKVFGIEIVKEAVENANKLAELNGNREKITNICGDAGKELPKLIQKIKENYITTNQDFNVKEKITIIIDPPRKGIDKGVIEGINSSNADKIIYISCNPATLTRDLELLKDNYIINEVLPHDMFPQTPHIETLVCLTKKC